MLEQGSRLQKKSASSLKAGVVFLEKMAAGCAAKCWNFHGSRLLAGWNLEQSLRLEETMSIGTIILIILVIALLGGFSGIGGGPFYGTGYYGGGGLGLIIVILLILLLLGRL
jgi:Protein of unknown function (DUF3309)